MKKTLKILFVSVMFMCFMVVVASAENLELEANDNAQIPESEYEYADFFFPEGEVEPIKPSVLETLEENETFAENEISISLNGLHKSNTDFVDIIDKDDLRLPDDPSNVFFGLQGGCFDGQYYYYAFIVKDHDLPSEAAEIDIRIVCVNKNFDGSFSIVALNSGFLGILQHANDMTYNANTGEIIIACCENYEQKVYSIEAEDLQYESLYKNFTEHNLSCMITSIAYNKTRNQYVVAVKAENTKIKNYMAILDGDFNLIKCIGDETEYRSDSVWARGGIYCDNKYIYYSYAYYYGDTRPFDRTIESRIRIFDWSGEYKKTLTFVVNKDGLADGEKKYYEIENIIFTEDRVLLGFNCLLHWNDRNFCYVDITDKTYHIEYCPDENVNAYIGVDNDNVSSIMFRELPTELYKFRVRQSGKLFTGWTLYRTEVNKWYYQKPDGSRVWCVEGTQPEGSTKVIYADKQAVTQTGGPGEHLLLCAQWADTNRFYITFQKNGGKGSMNAQEVIYGTGANLTQNTFTKDNRSFCGWNAYWSELNKWYYTDSDGNRGWYAEGFEPAGYKKYVYSDCQRVVQTVHAGSHLYMYAAWDEYRVYCDANGAKIKLSGIKPMVTARNCSGYINSVNAYTTADLDSGTFNGCHLYIPEEDKWYYQSSDGSDKGWYKEGSQPAGYSKYLKPFNSSGVASFGGTAPVGETLILVAQWS